MIPEILIVVKDLRAESALVNAGSPQMNGVFMPHHVVFGESPPSVANVAFVWTQLQMHCEAGTLKKRFGISHYTTMCNLVRFDSRRNEIKNSVANQIIHTPSDSSSITYTPFDSSILEENNTAYA